MIAMPRPTFSVALTRLAELRAKRQRRAGNRVKLVAADHANIAQIGRHC